MRHTEVPIALVWALLLSAAAVDAATLTIYVAPPEDGLTVQAIEMPSKEEIEVPIKQREKTRHVFVLDESALKVRKQDSPFITLDLVALKAAGEPLEQITVSMPSALSAVFVKLFLTEPKLVPQTILSFQKRGLNGEGAYRTYFEARKVYRGVRAQSPRHPLIVPAAFWFFAAAYELARHPESVITIDKEAIEGSRDVLRRGRVDQQMAEGFRRYSVDRAHWESMIGKAERLEWRLVSLVERQTTQKNFAEAAALNAYFTQQFAKLDTGTRLAVAKEYGVNRKLLANNQRFLASVSDRHSYN